MKKIIFLFFLLFLKTAFASAETLPIAKLIERSLLFIQNDQKQQDRELYWKGEWPVEMRSYLMPALLGVGKFWAQPTQEPTSFATASIINLLSEAYRLNPHYQQIFPMIEKGLASLEHYKDGKVFNYYNWVDYQGIQVRGPKASGYVPGYIQGLTHIPSDADTTSTIYLAKAYYDFFSKEKPIAMYQMPQEVLATFSQYRDINRTPHYYNRLDSIKNSGAFLTWFLDENKMPKGLTAKPDQGARIPFGVNDVDCVVNANVLRLFTETNNSSQPGYEKSCELLNFVILKKKQTQCGIYYPNSYAVFFSISNAFKAGAKCLQDSQQQAIDFIITTQNEDGSWLNEPGLGRTDSVQSTALALNALMNYTASSADQYQSSVRAGINYLISQRKNKNAQQAYWKGEVFFSAVAQARNTVLWRSDSYTTALVTLTLIKAENYLQEHL